MPARVDGAGIPAEALREVENCDAHVVVELEGKPVAILVSPRYLKAFHELAHELEDRLDLEAYRETRKLMDETGECPVAYEEFRKELGI